MFIFGQDSLALTIAAIVATWVVVSFGLVLTWIMLIEGSRFVQQVRANRAITKATNRIFQEAEELRNDFN